MSKKLNGLYVIRLTQMEVAIVVETLTTMAQVEADNEDFTEEARLKKIIKKILDQASKSEVK